MGACQIFVAFQLLILSIYVHANFKCILKAYKTIYSSSNKKLHNICKLYMHLGIEFICYRFAYD